MNIEQNGIITLIKSALSGEKLALPDGFDFVKACETAKAHGVSAIIYYGALNCGIDSNSAEMQMLFLATCTYFSVSERQMFMLNSISKAFEENGISYMPLKGTVLKALYPKTEMRVMGDADILIRMEEYDKVREIMLSLGFDEGGVSDHEIKWLHESLYVELHSKLIPSYNKDYYAYFGNGWQLAKENDGNKYRFKMTAEDELIYLFTHFAKHYRDAGIGIKHILDIWVYLKANSNLNEEYIKEELGKLELLNFYLNILDTLEAWFENKPETPETRLITDVIFKSGAAGTYESSVVSAALKSSKGRSTRNAGMRKIFKKIFTPFEVMRKKYKILNKAPVLLPIYWVVNIAEVLNRKGVSTVVGDLQTIQKKNIDSYQEALNFVGLDFNFEE